MGDEGEGLWIGDKLPTMYEVVQTIMFYSPTISSNKQKDIVNRYALAVRRIWIESFTEKHVITLTSVKRKIENLLKDYEQRVRKSRALRHISSIRARNKIWMNMDVPEPKTFKGSWRPGTKISSLFDIGKNIETSTDKDGNVIEGLTGNEKIFYEDQLGERRHLLSQDIDTEFEDEQFAMQEAIIQDQIQVQQELEYINEDQEPVIMSPPRNPPTKRVLKVDKKIQCNLKMGTKPIRQVRNCTYEILDTISSVSTVAGISVAKARKATREVCKRSYGDIYELEPPDQPVRKKPRTSEDYNAYVNVLPFEKAVNNFKHKKAITKEKIAAKALFSKKATTKVTLHFDTTSRSRIDGDWPSLIFNFKDDNPIECRMLSVRPLFFAFENRDQIVSLIVETFKRLSASVSDKLDVSPSQLWEKVDAIMTDAVTKNLEVEKYAADELGSSHIPYHILCKSHTCERLDSDNLTTLSNIEAKVGLRELLLKREPLLKSFLRSKKSVVESALEALLKLVATEGDGKTTSLSDLFQFKLEEAGLHKSFSLYKEKRFTRLGYQAGAVYDCIPFFRQILNETPLNNLLVRACRIYLENDFIIAGLKALANFTYKVTMPFLNFVERTDQDSLVDVLPKLCTDLKNGRMDTLSEYLVEWKHVHVVKNGPETELDHYLLGEMCVQAAIGVELQCKREYWADDDEATTSRATRLHNLTSNERKNLPTNNLNCERYLAKFGYLAAQSAAHSNRFFKGKRIRDDLVLSDADELLSVEKSITKTMKVLDEMELSWTSAQKEMKRKHILENLQKKVRANDFIDHLLVICKQHNGPLTSVDELKTLVKGKSPKIKSFLRQEIQYQRVTHPRDVEARKDLYKVNKITVEEMIQNLTVIFSEDTTAEESILFPSEDEIMDILHHNVSTSTDDSDESTTESTTLSLSPNQPVAVIWDSRNKRNWYVGFFIDMNEDGTYRVDHMERVSGNDKWRRPSGSDDIQDTDEMQILPVPIVGDWTFDTDKPIFNVYNSEKIMETFDEVCS